MLETVAVKRALNGVHVEATISFSIFQTCGSNKPKIYGWIMDLLRATNALTPSGWMSKWHMRREKLSTPVVYLSMNASIVHQPLCSDFSRTPIAKLSSLLTFWQSQEYIVPVVLVLVITTKSKRFCHDIMAVIRKGWWVPGSSNLRLPSPSWLWEG